MAIFGIFGKRNKQAKPVPFAVRDYMSSTDSLSQNEPSSFSAIDKIANSFASLGFAVYSKSKKEKVSNHWLNVLLDEPNLEETHSLFFKLIIRDYFAGNVFLLKAKNLGGEIVSLFRCNPDAVTVTRDSATHQKLFTYNGKVYTAEQILHIPAPYGYNGLKGGSIFSELRETFETSKNLNGYTSNSFNNNMGKRLVIDATEAMEDMDDEEQQQLRDKFVRNYAGVKNAGKPIVKTNGLKFETLDTGSVSNQAQELKDNREFQSFLISQIFHIPLDMIRGSTPSQIEALTTLYVMEAVQPIAQDFEESFNRLLDVGERTRYYFEFSYNNLLKTSLTTRVDAYTKQLTNGQLTIDEVRAKENLSPFGTKAASTPFMAANLMPVRDDVVDAYMASAKEKQAGLNDSESPKTEDNDAPGVGDDKK